MLLEKMTQTFGVSGRECAAVDFVKELLAPFADEVMVDAMGSLILVKKGNGSHKKKIMAAAHIDQIGFCVTGVDDKGFLRVRPMGGINIATTHTSRLVFQNGIRGVIYAEENDWSKNDLTKLYVDIGAKSQKDALSLVSVGDFASYEGALVELANGRFLSHGFDDRIGCYILAESFQKQEIPYNDLYFSFSVQEELGIRGTRATAFRVNPDIGIAFDIGGAYDTPGCNVMNMGNAVLGGGASIKVVDGWMVSDEKLNLFLENMCKEKKIPFQKEIASGGGTDGAMIQAARDGIKSTTISIPTRYGHSPSEMVDMHDVNACIELLNGVCMSDLTAGKCPVF